MHTLETPRLILRPPKLTDAPAMARIADNPAIARNMLHFPSPYTEADAAAFIQDHVIPNWERLENRLRLFAIIRKMDGAYMGGCGVHPHPFNKVEIGYWLGEPYWGQGCATEATRALIDYAFTEMGVQRVFAHYFSFNPASRRVQEKAGMQYEGLLRWHYCKDGEPIDAGVCGITRADWEAARTAAP